MPLMNPALEDLRARLEAMERGETSRSQRWKTGCAGLDALLPGGGFRAGSLVEWLTNDIGSGAMTLAMLAGAKAIGSGRRSVVIDSTEDFYPPAVAWASALFGEPLVLRPRTEKELLWTWEQVLRCRGIGPVVGWIPHAHERSFRRLSLAAESGQALGMVLRSAAARCEPSWADARLLVEPLCRCPFETNHSRPRELGISVLHARGAAAGSSIKVHWDEETNALCLAGGLGRSAPARASPQAS